MTTTSGGSSRQRSATFDPSPTEPTTSTTEMVEIPKGAVRRDGDQDVVFVVKDERLERRAVKVSGTEGDAARVISGLAAGETIAVTGEELADGDRVKVQTK